MNRILLMVLRNVFIVPGAYLKLCRYAKHPERYTREEMYRHIQFILKTAVKSGNIELKVRGLENIPKEKGYMMYSNHQGLFDILAIAATMDTPFAVVLKKELYKIPFLKQLVDCTGSYPMDRDDVRGSLKIMQSVTDEVKSGRNFLIFPEGTRSRKGNELIDFHGGSFRCATRSECPILPIALIDCFKVLDEKGSKPVTVQIHFLPVIPYEEYKDMKASEVAVMVHDRIVKVIEENS